MLAVEVTRYRAFAGVMMVRHDELARLVTVTVVGTAPGGGQEPAWLALSFPSPITATASDGLPRDVASAAELRETYGLEPLGPAGAVTLPLVASTGCVGAVGLWIDQDVDQPRLLREQLRAVDALPLALAQRLERSQQLADQLQGALDSRIVIEQAKGILAVCLRVSPPEAFDALRRLCRARGLTIHQVARELVDSASGDDEDQVLASLSGAIAGLRRRGATPVDGDVPG